MTTKYFLSCCIALMICNSCSKDILNNTPSNAIDASIAVTNLATTRSAVIGLYSLMAKSSYYGSFAVVVPDLEADNLTQSVQNNGDYTAFNKNSALSTGNGDVASLWNQLYAIVINANTIINKAKSIQVGTNDSAELKQLIGEAYAVRALTYFDLARWFAPPWNTPPFSQAGSALGVPLVDSSYPQNRNQLLYPARSTVAQTYAHIVNDIDSGLVYLPANGNVINTGVVDPSLFRIRLNYFGLNALAARVYLYEDDYADAVKAATVVINSPLYQLFNAATIVSDFHQQSAIESIFEVANNQFNNQGTNGVAYEYSQNGYGEFLATMTTYNLYGNNDPRLGFMTIGNRSAFAGETSVPLVNKYSNIKSYQENIKVFRLAEMYLIRSEAEFNLGGINVQAGINDLSTIVKSRQSTTVLPTASSTLAQQITAVLLERRKEFAFEGHRLFDITRNAPLYGNGVAWTKTTQFNGSGASYTTVTRRDTSHRNILPIPNSEINDDPNILQNPGY